MNKVKVKVMPAETHVKVQYEGEELTIRELIERLEDVQAWRKHWKEFAMRQDEQIDELIKQLSDVQPVRYGKWITVVETNGKEYSKCANCQMELDRLEDAYSFCPYCGAKMDGEVKTMEYKSPCNNCKWHNVFWEGAGCTLLNNMDPCHFEAKDINVPTKSGTEEEDDG